MNLKHLFMPPLFIYAVIFISISALVGAGADHDATWVWIISLVITLLGLALASKTVRPRTIQDGLGYGLVWLSVFVILDLVITVLYVRDYFTEWKSYVPYVLTILMPMLYARK